MAFASRRPANRASYSDQLFVAGNPNLIDCCLSKPSGLMSKTPAPLQSEVEDPSKNSNQGVGSCCNKGVS